MNIFFNMISEMFSNASGTNTWTFYEEVQTYMINITFDWMPCRLKNDGFSCRFAIIGERATGVGWGRSSFNISSYTWNHFVNFTFTVEESFGIFPREGQLGWKGSQQLNDVGNVIWRDKGGFYCLLRVRFVKARTKKVQWTKQTFLLGECASRLRIKKIVPCGQLKCLQHTKKGQKDTQDF